MTVLPIGSLLPKSRRAVSSLKMIAFDCFSACWRLPNVRGKSNNWKNVESAAIIFTIFFSWLPIVNSAS